MDTLSLTELGWHAWMTMGIILTIVIVLVFTRLPSDYVFLGGLGILLISGILDPAEALSGFSSQGVVTVAVLYVVVSGLKDTGGLSWISRHVLGRPKTYRRALMRLMLPVCGLSAFLNNTPVVALFHSGCQRMVPPDTYSVLPAVASAQLCGDFRRPVYPDRHQHQPGG